MVALLFFTSALNYANRIALATVFPLLRADLHMSDVELAAVGSLFSWSYALASPLAGYVADRYSRSRLVVISLAVWSIAAGAAGFAATTGQLLATRVFLGLAECIYMPAAVVLIASHHPVRTRATAMALHLNGQNLGLIGGGFLGGYLGERFGWRPMSFILGFGGLGLAVLCQLFLRDAKTAPLPQTVAARPPLRIQDVFGVLRTPTFAIILIESMILSGGSWMYDTWTPLFYHETFGLSLASAGFSATSVIGISCFLGMMVGAVASDRIAARRLDWRMLLQTSAYALAAPCLFGFFFSRSFALLSTLLFMFTFLRSIGTANEHPIVCDVLPPSQRSTAIGLMNCANAVAGGLVILAAGYLKGGMGLGKVIGDSSVLMIAATALTLFGYAFTIRRDLQRAGAVAALQFEARV